VNLAFQSRRPLSPAREAVISPGPASPSPSPPHRHGRALGLRARVTFAFTAGAAALSGLLAGTTYALVHHYLLAQREEVATTQTYSDARLVKAGLALPGTNVAGVLSSLPLGQGTLSLLYRHGQWYSASVAVGEIPRTSRPPSLPPALVTMVSAGTPARQRVISEGQPAVAIGLPVRAAGADYFEVHSLTELSRTLGLLALVLVVSALATTVGGVLVGRWASRRLVRPLSRIADVAAAIAGGALEQRLPRGDDPDLDVLSASFNEMVSALQRRIERDARFASDVSHELRSPLTTVQATVELLQVFRGQLPPEGNRALDLLKAEVGRFSSMVQDLLEISRFDAGAANLDLEELPLDDLVVNSVATYSAGTIPVEVASSARGALVRADRRRIQRVLVNLLDNARRYAGGAVLVSVGRRAGWLAVCVDDAGPGVAGQEREQIFERFYRGAAAGRRAEGFGSGLGLALANEHIKAHQGRLNVEDRPGGGARFVMELPASDLVPASDLRPGANGARPAP
jgi:two-component system sensor histidine kinase MtrB